MSSIMGAYVGEISSDFAVKSSARLSTKNAWALYARRLWPTNGVKAAMAEWDLTEGEAKGLFAAQISQPTIDKIYDHPRGGMRIALLITEIRFQTALRGWLSTETERLNDEAARAAADAAALAAMAGYLPSALGLGAVGVDRLGAGRGGGRREVRSFVGDRPDRRPE